MTIELFPSLNGAGDGAVGGEKSTIFPKQAATQNITSSGQYVNWTSGLKYDYNGGCANAGTGNNIFVMPSTISFAAIDIYITLSTRRTSGSGNITFAWYKNGASAVNNNGDGSGYLVISTSTSGMLTYHGAFLDVPVAADDNFGLYVPVLGIAHFVYGPPTIQTSFIKVVAK